MYRVIAIAVFLTFYKRSANLLSLKQLGMLYRIAQSCVSIKLELNTMKCEAVFSASEKFFYRNDKPLTRMPCRKPGLCGVAWHDFRPNRSWRIFSQEGCYTVFFASSSFYVAPPRCNGVVENLSWKSARNMRLKSWARFRYPSDKNIIWEAKWMRGWVPQRSARRLKMGTGFVNCRSRRHWVWRAFRFGAFFLFACLLLSALADRLCGGVVDVDVESALAYWSVQKQEQHYPAIVPPTSLKHSKTQSIKQALKSFWHVPRPVTPLDYVKLPPRSRLFCIDASFLLRMRRLPNSAFVVRSVFDLCLEAEAATWSTCVCGERLNPLGDNALSCGCGTGFHAWYKEVNAQIRWALAAAGASATLEPVGLDLRRGKRPDWANTFPFLRGRAMAWDATVCHMCAFTYAS